MKAKNLFIAVFCINLLACLSAAFADGGVFIRRKTYTNADVFQPTQKVYIRWDGSQEKLLIQTKYEGPAEEMVWIVPVPSQPTVEKADGAVFQDLSKETLDPAIDYTDFPSLNMMAWGAAAGGGGSSGTTPVEWQERIGDYEVALLRPVGEDVIQWLNANGFTTPEAINPVLEDYIREGWWMVAAKIAPEALTPITRDKLAQGTLHPLEMTFQSSACLYPMRLTRLVAGPVEELIYIEGPHHYEPATVAGDGWAISLFGGPIRKVRSAYYLSDVEHAVEIIEGRTRTQTSPCLTKLRRVFQPSEMTEDIIFRELDLAKWLSNKNLTPPTPTTPPPTWPPDPEAQAAFEQEVTGSAPLQIAQAATQYGRWRDPNGITFLASVLAPDVLHQVQPPAGDFQKWSPASIKFLSWWGIGKWSYGPTNIDWPLHPGCVPLRSCVWALGEIALEHPLDDAAQETLLRCAQHDNELIRMEAYIALAKVRGEKFGTILMDRLTRVLQDPPIASPMYVDGQSVMAELDVLADWIWQFGTADQKSTLVGILRDLLSRIPSDTRYPLYDRQSSIPTAYGDWPTWIVWRAACTQDSRLIPVLESRHPQYTNAQPDFVPGALLRAEAACGSPSAIAALVHQAVDDANEILQRDQSRDIPHTSLDAFYGYSSTASLRVMILLWIRGLRYEFYPMPSDAADGVFRSATSTGTLTDWHLLYLLARIKHPKAQDEEVLMRIWGKHEEPTQLLVVDVLYAWNDERLLLDLYSRPNGLPGARSEIAWALAAMAVPEGASIIEEQVRDCWNGRWLSLHQSFIHRGTSGRASSTPDPLPVYMRRDERALWDYFHPVSGVLDPKRLAALKRLAADSTIHAGMRFDLLGVDYGGTDWGLPLLENAARDILAIDSSSATLQKIMSTMKSVGNSGFVVVSR